MKNTKINWNYLFMVTLVAVVAFMPELAMAQGNDMKGNFATLLSNPLFKGAIDLGLIIFAGYKWFMYFANFDPASAFKEVIVPAGITFLAFQWTDVLKWVQLI
jgi:hypothetical protein